MTHLTVIILFGQTTDAKNDENGDAELSEYDEDDEDDDIDMELDFKEQFLKDMNEDDMDDDDYSSCSSSTSSTSSPVNSQDHESLSHSQIIISKEEAAVVDNKQKLQRRTVVGSKSSSNMNRCERVSGFAAEGFEEYLSQDSIAQAILKPCCHDECLRKKLNSIGGSFCLNFESVNEKILAARKQLVGNKTEDKMLVLKTIIQGIYVYMCKKTLSFY